MIRMLKPASAVTPLDMIVGVGPTPGTIVVDVPEEADALAILAQHFTMDVLPCTWDTGELPTER